MDEKPALQDITELYTVIRVQHRKDKFPNWPDLVYVLDPDGWWAIGSDGGGFPGANWDRWAAGPYAYTVVAKPVS